MSLFVRQPKASNPINYASHGLNQTILLVGLGNIGDEYKGTRHNIGFESLDHFVENYDEMSKWTLQSNLKAQISSGKLSDKRVIAIKPTTYMNHSGDAVLSVSNFYRIDPSHIVVIYDDLDINFGQIRIRMGGSSAGHNGIKSITKNLKTEEYGRVRIGIGPKSPDEIDTSDYVLQKFNSDEKKEMNNLTKEVTSLLTEHIYSSDLLNEETRQFIF